MDDSGDSDAARAFDAHADEQAADALTAEEIRAMTDWQSGRICDSDTLVGRLGGWQVMVQDAAPSASHPDRPASHRRARLPPPSSSAAGPPDPACALPLPLHWAASAAMECDRLHQIIRTVDEDAALRFAATLIRTIVRLMVEGVGERDGAIAEVPLLPSLELRILVTAQALVVLGLRSVAPIT